PRVGTAVGQRAVVGDTSRATTVAAVVRDEHLVPAAAPLERVCRQVNLVRAAAGEPRPVAVVAVRGPLIPGLATVTRGEQGVVCEIDAGVVNPATGVLGQVGVAEPR